MNKTKENNATIGDKTKNILRLVKNGTNGETPEGPNWLSHLEPGTHFLTSVREDITNPYLTQFIVISHLDNMTLLLSNMNGDKWTYVHTLRFSLLHNLDYTFPYREDKENDGSYCLQ